MAPHKEVTRIRGRPIGESMKAQFKTGDLVYAKRFHDVGIGIVLETLDDDIVNVYWLKDKIAMAASFVSIKKVEANENKV